MNSIVPFAIFLLTIVVFFGMYALFYKQMTHIQNNNNVEQFMSLNEASPRRCEFATGNFFYLHFDNEIQGCVNNVDNFETERSGSLRMYNYNGVNSYTHVKDFFDNFFDIELYVKFKRTNPPDSESDCISPDQTATLIHTKYIEIKIENDLIKIIYTGGEEPEEKMFANICINKNYKIKIVQTRSFNKIDIYFGLQEERVLDNLEHHEFDVVGRHKCEFEYGNDIYIGVNRNDDNTGPGDRYINAYIGNLQLNIDKSKYDDYLFEDSNTELPEELECVLNTVDIDASIEPVSTTQITVPFKYVNYLEILSAKIFNDLKIQYKDTDIVDNLSTLEQSRLGEINNFYSSLTNTEEIFENKNRLLLEKDDSFFNGYSNLGDSQKEYISYFIDLKDNRNNDIVSRLPFLNLSFIKQNLQNQFESVNLFIYGKRTKENSFFKFLKMDKPIFILVIKQPGKTFFEYIQIHINIDIFYKFQKDYLVYFLQNQFSQNSVENYTRFLNTKEIILSLNNDSVNNIDKEVMFNLNFIRLYKSTIDLDISVNKYSNGTLINNYVAKYKVEEESMVYCNFAPSGETKFDCIQDCNDNYSDNCKSDVCRELCNNCNNKDCKWNIVDINRQNKFVPDKVRVKGFAGDKRVKLSWVKPYSSYKIESYYIMVEAGSETEKFDMYIYNGNEELVDFIIDNLKNNMPYSFYVISKNSSGVSDISNRVSLIPRENKILEMENVSKNTYSDSLQNFYKNIDSNNVFYKSMYDLQSMENLDEIFRLKDIIVEKILNSHKINQNMEINVI